MKTSIKKCTNCETNRESSYFNKDYRSIDGLQSWCKICKNNKKIEYRKTKKGVISGIYSSQRSSSKKRNHKMPTYSGYLLRDWLLDDWLFNLLFDNWKNCGYLRHMKPSIDRLDDSNGYSFDNIQIVTWGENEAKGNHDMRSGKLIHGNKPHKEVMQYSKDGYFIKEFVSSHEASRQTMINQGNISNCCNGNKNYSSAGGFIWKFK